MKKAAYQMIGGLLWGIFIYGITPDLSLARSVGFGLVGLFAILAFTKSIDTHGNSDNKPEGQSSLNSGDSIRNCK